MQLSPPLLPSGSESEREPLSLHPAPVDAETVSLQRASTRERLGPLVAASNEVFAESARKQEAAAAKQPAVEQPREPSVPQELLLPTLPSVLPQERMAASPRESLVQGAAAAGLGTAAVVSVLPAYESAVLAPVAGTAAAGFFPSASTLGLTLGVPAIGGIAGYALGKKFHHPVAGTVTGLAAGAASTMALSPYLSLSAVAGMTGGATAGGIATLGALQGVGVLSGLAAHAALPLAAGAGLYGLGRWHEKIWGSAPGGLLKTMARGVMAPVTVPLGFLTKFRTRSSAS